MSGICDGLPDEVLRKTTGRAYLNSAVLGEHSLFRKDSKRIEASFLIPKTAFRNTRDKEPPYYRDSIGYEVEPVNEEDMVPGGRVNCHICFRLYNTRSGPRFKTYLLSVTLI